MRNTPASWGYEPHNGPALWGTLDRAFCACALGTEQSPIDLTGGRRVELAPVGFDYRRSRIEVENTGHTIQMNPEPGHGIVLDDVRHELSQFHFHRASEHLVDGVPYPMELHLVHRDGSGGLAVVGVLICEGVGKRGAGAGLGASSARSGRVPRNSRRDRPGGAAAPVPHDMALSGLAHDAALHGRRRLDRPGRAAPDVGGPDRRLRRDLPEQPPPRAAARRPRPAARMTAVLRTTGSVRNGRTISA